MSNDYKVRPMGADPRTSVTLTEREIIYRNGLIGSDTKRVPLADARVEYSSLIRGGELIVKDHGSEVFRVGGIINPEAFYEEFSRRKTDEANLAIPQSNVNAEETPIVADTSNQLPVFDTYYYCGENVGSRDGAIGRFMGQIWKDVRESSFSKYYNNFIAAALIDNGQDSRVTTITLPRYEIEFHGGRNKDALLAHMDVTGQDSISFPVKEEVLKMNSRNAWTIAYIPELEVFTARYNQIDKKTGEFTHSDTLITDSLSHALGGMDQEAKMMNKMVNVGSVVVGAAGALVGLFVAANAAFGAELPAYDAQFTADPSEYTIQMEP